MSKRGAPDDIVELRKRIKKLQEEDRRRRRRILFSESSSDDENTEGNEDHPPPDNSSDRQDQPAPTSEPSPDAKEKDATVSADQPDIQLDPDLLSALGESTSDAPAFGDKIIDNLAQLWTPLLIKGMPKENKESILKDKAYLIPDNCKLLQAPKLNAEIAAAVPDMVRNRDKNLVVSQQQLGTGITAINRAMDILLQGDDKIQAVKHLSNACRILTDLHAASTQSRIKLISPSLDKTFLQIIQDSERDDTLFGNKLSEKIKAAKAIEKQGLQIKKAPPNTKSSAPSQSTGTRTNQQGNWQAPPRYPSNRGGRGGFRRAPQPQTNRRPYSNSNYAPAQPAKTSSQNKPRAPTH
ncbi:hypothetical protein NE865_07875 [Phthorimaea operculella]|nr:hypothetical protein NE865_07875 [Phthorimaea operculella]